MPLYKLNGALIKYPEAPNYVSKDPRCCDCEEAGPCCPLCVPQFTANACGDRDEVWVNPGEPTTPSPRDCCTQCQQFGENEIIDEWCSVQVYEPFVICPGDGHGYWRLPPICPGDGDQSKFGCPDGREGCVWMNNGFDGLCLWDENTTSCDDPGDPGDSPCTSSHRWVLRLMYDPNTMTCVFDLVLDMGWTDWPSEGFLTNSFCDSIDLLTDDCFDQTSGVMAHWQLVLSAETDCDTDPLELTLEGESGHHCNWPNTVTIQIGVK